MNIQEVLCNGKNKLKNKGIASYDIDAKLLLMKTLNMNKIDLLTSRVDVSNNSIEKYENFLNRRCNFEPVAYITNNITFMGYDFYVDKNVLIPRGDTEILIYTAIDYINLNNYKTMLDIGTGSGCIPISLNLETGILATAIDISEEALEIAKKNSKLNNNDSKITFIKSNLLDKLDNSLTFDLITSNPPYIDESDMNGLMKDVIDYEPHIALYGGIDGLDFYRKITPIAFERLNSNGMLIYEIGYNQGYIVKSLLEENKFKNVNIIKDLQNHDRVVFGIK